MASTPGSDQSNRPLPARRRVANRIIALDLRIQSKLEHSKPPRWLRILTVWASRAGDGWIWGLVGLIALKFSRGAFESAALAVSIAITAFLTIKRAVRRSRPSPASWHRLPVLGSFSFPSGHAMTAFTVAAALAVFFPNRIPSLFCLAAAVSSSRVVAGMHFLSDVLAGAVLGCCIGAGVGVMFS